jgi:hypothetical protein
MGKGISGFRDLRYGDWGGVRKYGLGEEKGGKTG